MEDAKRKVRERLAAALDVKVTRRLASPPKYDAEFYEGLCWLDALAAEGEFKREVP